MINIIISGVCGRMGQKIAAAARSDADISIAGVLERHGHPHIGEELFPGITIQKDVMNLSWKEATLIEFSTPTSTIDHVRVAVKNTIPVVIGTTGFTEDQELLIFQASQHIPILKSHNFGIGMNAFWEIIRIATKLLKNDHDIEIIEFHGADKPDVPSGTGMTIANIIAKECGSSIDDVIRYGRTRTNVSTRNRHEICMHSLRAGGYRSDHTVIYAGQGERLEFTHREENTSIIAQGVLLGIRFLRDKPPGLYGMRDVMGFAGE